jgi:hypothetical protein
MAASRPPHVAKPRRCDVLEDAGLAPRDEAMEVLRCFRESLREPAFATALALLVSGKMSGEKDESAEIPNSGASARSGGAK